MGVPESEALWVGLRSGRCPAVGRQGLPLSVPIVDMDGSAYPIKGVPTPDPSYGPERVVGIQLEALAHNDDPIPKAGIKTAYNFASPANRRQTGPLDRFVRLVEGHQYAPLTDHKDAVRGPPDRQGSRSDQHVTLTGPDGRTVTDRFGVSKQSGGPLDGCWLTDRVLVV